MSIALAFDLGGSGMRAALVDASGAIKARHGVSLSFPTDGAAAECDPQIWWQALCDCAEMLQSLSPTDFADIGVVAATGMTRTNVFVDAEGASLRHAILWNDVRAEAAAVEMRDVASAHPESARVNAFHPVARLLWLQRAEPENWKRVAHVLDPKDFLNFKLTGCFASDRISHARLAAAAAPDAGGQSLFAMFGIDTSLVPELLAPVCVLGSVQPGLGGALEKLVGTRVVAMANDTWASVLGLGALRRNFGYNLSGTTEVLGVLSTEVDETEGLLRVDWSEGLVQSGGPSLSGGDTLAWVASVLGGDNADVATGAALDGALSQPRSGKPLLFLPYLRGERTPYWNPRLRGAWVGLARDHTVGDLAQAALEGVAFLNRIVVERAEAAAGIRVDEIRFGGGGAMSARWCQIKADILDRPFVTTKCPDHGLIGCAIAGFAAVGVLADIRTAQATFVEEANRFLPNARNRTRYEALYAQFRNAEAALAPISAALAGLESVPAQ